MGLEPYLELERRFGEWTGCSNVVACASGTAALHLALESMRLPLKSEVIVPSFSMIACARAVTLAGLVPVFVDCGTDLLLDVQRLKPVLTERTSAVMAVHTYGRRCDMDGISAFARQHGLDVIEDLAEGHGIPVHPESSAACWSFYKNKIVAGEEGGAVAFQSREHAKLALQLRSLGFTDAHDHWHIPRGHNYRLSNVHAELILKSLRVADENLQQRRETEAVYNILTRNIPTVQQLPARYVCWVYDLRIPGLSYDTQSSIVSRLRKQGIAARHGFKPLHQQPEYVVKTSLATIAGQSLPETERASREVIYLPVTPMSVLDVERICCALEQVAVP